uniref:PI-PLC X domain-containing protein 3 n=2 Tax=Lygus hesperus TaxID=30085 RepID=A0A0A9WZY2_LYGHE
MPKTAPRIPDIDLENWMGNLPENIKEKSLTWLSIPGSHNSGTCDLSSEAGNDAFCVNIPMFARPWATCQRFPITYQLEHGIRYLDFRLDFDSTKDRFFITHFLRSKSSPKTCLESVRIFLEEHPKEVVIIDFQHFYHFSDSLKDQFLAGVLDLFESMVCPVPNEDQLLTLAYMQANGFQVVLINRYKACKSCKTPKNLFFSPRDFPTYWPDTDNATEVIDKAKMACRIQHSFGYITQLVLTLQGAKNFVYLDLRNFYKSRMYGKAMTWLHNITGGSQPNIIITDFIDFHNFSFPRAVIKLNYLKEGESLSDLETSHVNVHVESKSLSPVRIEHEQPRLRWIRMRPIVKGGN